MSEYLFKTLQPKLDDILFIGKSYEKSFDEFEVLFALVVADIKKQRDEHVWGPIWSLWLETSCARQRSSLTHN